ncbi:22219_t:CDS:2 [Entrophospora sp. SA101]|nr:22219_t:CDS:2 [Entrophospora sp. SA101]
MAESLKVREPGEYVFENPLLEFFEEKDLPSIMVEATKERVTKYNTKDLEDDYVFTNKNIATIVGWLLQCRTKYKIDDTGKNKKGKLEVLRIKFEEYNKHAKISRMITGGNISVSDIEIALKTDTLKGYKTLVRDLYKDENDKEAEIIKPRKDVEEVITPAQKTKEHLEKTKKE